MGVSVKVGVFKTLCSFYKKIIIIIIIIIISLPKHEVLMVSYILWSVNVRCPSCDVRRQQLL